MIYNKFWAMNCRDFFHLSPAVCDCYIYIYYRSDWFANEALDLWIDSKESFDHKSDIKCLLIYTRVIYKYCDY